MLNTHQFIISRCLSALQGKFVFVIFTSSKIAICKNVSPGCIIHLKQQKMAFLFQIWSPYNAVDMVCCLIGCIQNLLCHMIYTTIQSMKINYVWVAAILQQASVYHIRAKFSRVFNFVNFANFQPFAKIFQLRFWHAACSVRVQWICEIISTKIAIR